MSKSAVSLVIVFAALFTSCGGSGAGSSNAVNSNSFRAVGLLPNPPQGLSASVQQYSAAIDTATTAGINGAMLPYTWLNLEPSSGTYSLSDITGLVNRYSAAGFKIYLGIQVINTSKREMPADLATAPFDSALVKQRFHALIDALKPVLTTSNVTYLTIGNEVDVYLGSHPDEQAAYQSFYQDAVAYAHQIAPNLKVGVVSTAAGRTSAQMNSLNSQSDIIALTYYPNPPQQVLTDFPAFVSSAGQKPVVIQEIGCSSSAFIGSSDASQAECISNIFKAWQQNAANIPFLTYFTLHDVEQQSCDQLSIYYNGKIDPTFEAGFCYMGLRRVDGSTKPAWQAFSSGAAGLK